MTIGKWLHTGGTCQSALLTERHVSNGCGVSPARSFVCVFILWGGGALRERFALPVLETGIKPVEEAAK